MPAASCCATGCIALGKFRGGSRLAVASVVRILRHTRAPMPVELLEHGSKVIRILRNA